MNNLALIEQICSEFSLRNDVLTTSIRGTARLVDVDESALRKAFNSVRTTRPSKLGQMLIDYGFDPTNFNKTGVPSGAVAIIVCYYASFAGERCTEQAKQFNLVFSNIGFEKWAKQMLGVEEKNIGQFFTEASKVVKIEDERMWAVIPLVTSSDLMAKDIVLKGFEHSWNNMYCYHFLLLSLMLESQGLVSESFEEFKEWMLTGEDLHHERMHVLKQGNYFFSEALQNKFR